MEKSINDTLFDALTLRSILLERVKNNTAADVQKVYKTIFDDMIKRIKEEDVIDASNMNQIIKELKEIIAPELPLYTDMQDLALTEASYISATVNAAAGAAVFSKIPKDSTLLKIANTSLFEGYNAIDTFDAFDRKQKEIIEGQIKQAVYVGESIAEIKARLIKQAGIATNQAETLARTFVATTVHQVRDEVYRANEDVIKGYQWKATLDSKTRIEHSVRDNLVWDLEHKPVGHKLPWHNVPWGYNCRCIYSLVLKSYEELGLEGIDIPENMRSSMDGRVPKATSFDEWLKGKDEAFKEKYLGAGRYEMYKSGRITFSDLVSNKGEVLTIKELREKYS